MPDFSTSRLAKSNMPNKLLNFETLFFLFFQTILLHPGPLWKGGKFQKRKSFNYPESLLYCLCSSLRLGVHSLSGASQNWQMYQDISILSNYFPTFKWAFHKVNIHACCLQNFFLNMPYFFSCLGQNALNMKVVLF